VFVVFGANKITIVKNFLESEFDIVT